MDSIRAVEEAIQAVDGALIRVLPEATTCQVCGRKLHVYKSEPRTVITLAYGRLKIQEVIHHCPGGCLWQDGERRGKLYRSESLAALVAPGHIYGFDVLAKVGVLRFLRCRQRREIQAEIERLLKRPVPESTVGDITRQFVDFIRALHEYKVPVLREAFETAGGYVLHVDGTCEEGSQVQFACLTGPDPMVLWSDKIDSENAVQIRRVLAEVDKRFGPPAAVVEDLSCPIRNAVKEQWPGVRIFFCHQHFLADVGKDILGRAYNQLREALRDSEIRPTLRRFLKTVCEELGEDREEARWICRHLEDPDLLQKKGRSLKASAVAGGIAEWILAAAAEGSGKRFPYDLPHLSLCLRARKALEILDRSILPELKGRTPRGEKLLFRLRGVLHTFLKSKALGRIVQQLLQKNSFFLELRAELRLGRPQKRADDTDEEWTYRSPEEVRQAEEALIRFRTELRRQEKSGGSTDNSEARKIILKHLDEYWDGLFGHWLPLAGSNRYLTVERTNNLAERFFREVKRFIRRTTGKKKLNREVDAFSDQMLLVFNLKTPKYVDRVCGSLDQLPQAFAELVRKGKHPKRSARSAAYVILDQKARRESDFPTRSTRAFAAR